MKTFEVEVVNRAGLHTRPAAMLVKTLSKFKSNVILEKNGFKINGKSIIGVMTLAAEYGSKITFEVEGEDEDKVKEEVEELFNSGFGENK